MSKMFPELDKPVRKCTQYRRDIKSIKRSCKKYNDSHPKQTDLSLKHWMMHTVEWHTKNKGTSATSACIWCLNKGIASKQQVKDMLNAMDISKVGVLVS